MQIFKSDTHIDFMGYRKFIIPFSLIINLAGIVAYFIMGGFNYGVDFKGGTVIQVQFEQKPDLGRIRNTLGEGKFGSFSLQTFGGDENNEILIILASAEEIGISSTGEGKEADSLAKQVESALRVVNPDISIRRVESVGPKVGNELKQAAWESVAAAVVAILLYVWFRFQWRYGVASVLALLHDVLFVLSIFIFTQKEITLTVVAAVLTVAGYSINDTIVIMDRIRDNVLRSPKMALTDLFNMSINQTLSRTALTSGTTLLVVTATFFLGGEIIHDFSLALLVGIAVGTYSSIFVASPLVLLLNDKFPPQHK
ncbi:MAG: protein translocase subunit SecF [Deltaproteobacteria bacterium]|nr:protein translocase subunit SecF [Deltaproteobacteria bacterium]